MPTASRTSVGAGGGIAGAAATTWALAGISALLLFAVVRLGGRGLATLRAGLGAWEWAALLVATAAFVAVEGRGAFEKRWVPRVIRRAASLRRQSRLPYRLLAPLYGMSLIGAPLRQLLRSWGLTVGIVVLVVIVATFPEPWRGITDLAVAAALVWGVGSIAARAPDAFR